MVESSAQRLDSKARSAAPRASSSARRYSASAGVATEPAEHVRAGRRQQVVCGERRVVGQPIDKHEPLPRPLAHRDRDRAVQFDDRRRGDGGQVVVEGDDGRPVGVGGRRRPHVLPRDRGLEAVDADPPGAGGVAQRRLALPDHVGIPQAPVLVVEEDRHAVVSVTRRGAGMVEEHEREQAGRLRLSGEERREDAGEPDRLLAQLVADGLLARRRVVALVEDQVEDRCDLVDALGHDRLGRLPEADPRHPQPSLRAHQPLGHDRLGDEEGARDLGRGETAGQAQGERHPGLGRKRRVAAGEDQLEAVVGQVLVGDLRGGLRAGQLELRQLLGERAVTPDAVDGDVPGGRDQPRRRLRRHAFHRPPGRRPGEGLLHGLLGQVRVAEPPPQRPDRPCPVIAECGVDCRTGPIAHRRARIRMTPSTMKTAPDR